MLSQALRRDDTVYPVGQVLQLVKRDAYMPSFELLAPIMYIMRMTVLSVSLKHKQQNLRGQNGKLKTPERSQN